MQKWLKKENMRQKWKKITNYTYAKNG